MSFVCVKSGTPMQQFHTSTIIFKKCTLLAHIKQSNTSEEMVHIKFGI
jgi:hypothetical protein